MKRIIFDGYHSSVNSQARHTRINVYFSSGEGEKYVWTPDWKKGTRQLFLEAYHLIGIPQGRVKQTVTPAVVQVERKEKPEGEIIDFGPLAYKIGEMFKNKTSVIQIEQLAAAFFNFKARAHVNVNITNIISQSIYDWVVTLGEQPIDQEKKTRLLKQFVGALAPAGSPLKKLAEIGR